MKEVRRGAARLTRPGGSMPRLILLLLVAVSHYVGVNAG